MGEDTFYGDKNPFYENTSCSDVEEVFEKKAEEARFSQLDFLNKCAGFYCGETWHLSSPKEKISTLKKIASSHDEERAYVITEDENELIELGKGLGTMSGIMRKRFVSMPEILLGGLKEGIYTDFSIVILDEEVSEKLLRKELKRSKCIKPFDSETINKIEKEELLFDRLKNKLTEMIGRLEEGERMELKERGFVAERSVVFSDFEKLKFVQIDGRYYAGLKKEFPKAKFFFNFEGDYPLVGLREEEELKAIILPIIAPIPAYKNFVKKVIREK